MSDFVALDVAVAMFEQSERTILDLVYHEQIVPCFMFTGVLSEHFFSYTLYDQFLDEYGFVNDSELHQFDGNRYFEFTGYVYIPQFHDCATLMQDGHITLNKIKISQALNCKQVLFYQDEMKFQGEYKLNQQFNDERDFQVVERGSHKSIDITLERQNCLFRLDELSAIFKSSEQYSADESATKPLEHPATVPDPVDPVRVTFDDNYRYALIFHHLLNYGQTQNLYTREEIEKQENLINQISKAAAVRKNSDSTLSKTFGDASNAAVGKELKSRSSPSAKLVNIAALLIFLESVLKDNNKSSIIREIRNIERRTQLRKLFKIEHPEIEENFLVGTLNTALNGLKHLIDMDK